VRHPLLLTSAALSARAAAEGLLETGSIEAILRERLAASRIAKMQATRRTCSRDMRHSWSLFSPLIFGPVILADPD